MPRMIFFGHAAVGIISDQATFLIDPYLTGNPKASVKPEDISADFIVVTHAHGDHLGDAIGIAKRCKATLVANFEIATYAAKQGVEICPMHIGGAVYFPFGRIKLTPALHGSTMEINGQPVTLGIAAGVVISIENKHFYHAGDTGLFGDMRLIGEDAPLDLAMLSIGDRFTMGVKDAVKAAQLLQPKLAVPMHYSTFPQIEADPKEFVNQCHAAGVRALVVQPNRSIEY